MSEFEKLWDKLEENGYEIVNNEITLTYTKDNFSKIVGIEDTIKLVNKIGVDKSFDLMKQMHNALKLDDGLTKKEKYSKLIKDIKQEFYNTIFSSN